MKLTALCGFLLSTSYANAAFVVSRESATFGRFYYPVEIGWLTIGFALLAAVAVVATAMSGGAAIPGAAALGSALGLTGAAAASVGAALLAGTAGTLLVATITFSTNVLADVAIERFIFTPYDISRMQEASKRFLSLPPPRSGEGGPNYEAAVAALKTLDNQQPLHVGSNAACLRAALDAADARNLSDNDEHERCQQATLQALLHFQLQDFPRARQYAASAIDLARKLERRRTLPAFIVAVASLHEETVNADEIFDNYLNYAILAEPDNKLLLLLTAVFLDSAQARYRNGEAFTIDHFRRLAGILGNEKLDADYSTPALTVVVARALVLVKQDQQTIYSVSQSESGSFLENQETPSLLRRHLQSYRELLAFIRDDLGRVLASREDVPKEYSSPNLLPLVGSYLADVPNLENAIAQFERRAQGASPSPAGVASTGSSAPFVVLVAAIVVSLAALFLKGRKASV